MVALQYSLPPDDSEATRITPRRIDDLPDHVKRNHKLDVKDTQGAEWDRTCKGYFAHIDVNNQIGSKTQVLPVEFLRNQNTNEDDWYILAEHTINGKLGLYTNETGKLI